MKLRKKIVIALAFVAVIIIGFYLYNFMKIDSCLDNGGKWNYQRDVCDS